jgi:hypothetical protein
MIKSMVGDRGAEHLLAAFGKKLTSIECENALLLRFEDGTGIMLVDEGQSCCESRYMSTDDDLNYFVGAELTGAELADGPDEGGEDDCHETQFLKITTSKGVFTMVNHNEHNGYYGGFWIWAKPLEASDG